MDIAPIEDHLPKPEQIRFFKKSLYALIIEIKLMRRGPGIGWVRAVKGFGSAAAFSLCFTPKSHRTGTRGPFHRKGMMEKAP
jgi:hypothetical protein